MLNVAMHEYLQSVRKTKLSQLKKSPRGLANAHTWTQPTDSGRQLTDDMDVQNLKLTL